jgi:hypothetical protein
MRKDTKVTQNSQGRLDRRGRLFRFASAVTLAMCVMTIALWIWSQWTFARVTWSYVKYASDPFQKRELLFLMRRDAAEVVVRTDVYHPHDEAARAKLRLDLPREPHHVDLYTQSGVSTSEDGDEDAAEHWGFWYRSPEATRRKFIAATKTGAVGDGFYDYTEEDERAFFLPWWFLVVLFGLLPVIVAGKRIRRSLRIWGGRCPACGYDIRFATDRCPECGMPIDSNVGKSAR